LSHPSTTLVQRYGTSVVLGWLKTGLPKEVAPR
jgi:hypothetical protein